ncbi:hypothetical protein [Promicromonospora soli]|uniref:Uncharacterized protein n=1 Tax=Promicromonospora soli TaxID=2035533 RepID=A0A919G3D1_9MICO|nr:hypothetical protein [Promicromonospora soli]GHH77282.1 hypothetical protein GCM10017772_37870 [Promicromonospora soli]
MTDDDDEPRWECFGSDDVALLARRKGVLAELMREIDAGHILHGRIVHVEAFFTATDDVIVRLDDGTFAHVHPTWTGHVERPGYPEAAVLGSAHAALDFMARLLTAEYPGGSSPMTSET